LCGIETAEDQDAGVAVLAPGAFHFSQWPRQRAESFTVFLIRKTFATLHLTEPTIGGVEFEAGTWPQNPKNPQNAKIFGGPNYSLA